MQQENNSIKVDICKMRKSTANGVTFFIFVLLYKDIIILYIIQQIKLYVTSSNTSAIQKKGPLYANLLV